MSIFSSVPLWKHKRTAFDLSLQNTLTLEMGKLVPILCKEVLPGDKFRVQTNLFCRFNPLRSPVLQNIDVYTHYFFVPNRLLMPQKDWETFITGGKDGTETAQLPYMTLSDMIDLDDPALNGVGSLADYLGYPVQQNYVSGSGTADIDLSGNGLRVSTLPFRAVQLIWQEFFRDQNLTEEEFDFQNAVAYDGSELDNLEKLLTLRNRCWKKDYFTSALPWLQRGADVGVPVNSTGTADTTGLNNGDLEFWINGQWVKDYQVVYDYIREHNYPVPEHFNIIADDVQFSPATTRVSQKIRVVDPTEPDVDYLDIPIRQTTNPTAPVNVTNSNVTINDLRRSETLQAWLERNAVGGARYIEQILAHFGVVSSDARLQRPEYLGGGKQPVVISEVLQTSSTQSNSPQGTMAGHAVTAGQSMKFKRRFEEHGFIIGLMSVLPRASYSQGCPKMLTRFDKLDYAWPEFAHLGEQPILDRELYINGTDKGEGTFGYQSVYADYKFSNDEIHGDFKTNMNYWHQGRIFANKPSLNQSFVEAKPSKRIFAVSTEVQDTRPIWCEMYHSIQAIRALPKYGTPRMPV